MIANTILNQLNTLGRTQMWSWGARNFKAFSENTFNETPHQGGLFFQVSGYKFKGKVRIRLGYDDLYVIDFGTLRKGVFKTKKQYEGIFFDQMVDIIDEYVELDKEHYGYEG